MLHEFLTANQGDLIDRCRLKVALIGEFRHRVGDRVVQAAVEGAEFVHPDRRLPLEGEIGDRLAKVAVVVDHLVDGEAVLQQLAPVLRRGGAHLGERRPLAA